MYLIIYLLPHHTDIWLALRNIKKNMLIHDRTLFVAVHDKYLREYLVMRRYKKQERSKGTSKKLGSYR